MNVKITINFQFLLLFPISSPSSSAVKYTHIAFAVALPQPAVAGHNKQRCYDFIRPQMLLQVRRGCSIEETAETLHI